MKDSVERFSFGVCARVRNQENWNDVTCGRLGSIAASSSSGHSALRVAAPRSPLNFSPWSARYLHRRVAFLPFVRTRFKSLIHNSYDFEPRTIGEHIKKRRLILNLFQKQLAPLLNVNEITIVHWEKGKTKPGYGFMPRIIEFLGYDPEPMVPTSLPELLKTKRKEMGWTIREASRILGVDPTSWSRWEWGRIPIERHKLQICFLLEMPRALLNETLVPRADPGSM